MAVKYLHQQNQPDTPAMRKTLPLVFHFLIIFIYLLFLWSTRSAFSFILRLVLLYLSYVIFFVTLRPESGSWPPLRGFVITLTGPTTPLEE